MKRESGNKTEHPSCPACGVESCYRYGHTAHGKQRLLCLVCGRQFTLDPSHVPGVGHPACPRCGRAMHLYKRENGVLRFRCSRYPECRTYLKHLTEVNI